ncbi:MAG: hypothetical protein JRG94_23715 [Deltaproteobacteria bacterium]|nr:hypothetical protein [Deltaproteobacteria bacterium]MBW2724490.1 hypothetical protein [Deltaproteobacteria bacterium]
MSDGKSRPTSPLRNAVGLCFDCRHARKLANSKGNEFYRCEKAREDDSLTAYPPLPVSACHGFEAAGEAMPD